MKICIFTGKFGMGHFAAAQALKQQIEEDCGLKANVEVIDWLEYAVPRFADKYYSFYTFLVNRGRGFYNSWYRFYENKKPNQKPEFSSYFEWCFTKFMEEKKPDLIISTLPTCSRIVSLYKENTGCAIPLVTCVTDITDHSQWISKNTALYLVGSQVVKEKFIGKGVSPDKIYVTGIPVRMDFIKDQPTIKTRSDSKIKKLLIMGGGLGMLPEDMEFYEGLNSFPNTKTTVITGKNTRLLQLLEGRFPNINVLGFVDNISDYMKLADLIVTKPGGITTFEAIHAEVPIVALNPYLQQEIYNAHYIEEMKIGTIVYGDSYLCLEEIENILECGILKEYRSNIQQIKKNLAVSNFTNILKKEFYGNRMIRGSQFSRNEGLAVDEKISFNI